MSNLQSTVPSSNPEPTGTDDSKSETKKEEVHDCYYFLTTGCTKGDQCKFRHKEEVKEVNMLCQRFLHGGCFNPDCKFIHLTILPSLASQKPHSKPQSAVKECIFFKKGFCKNGDKCPFLHPTNNQESALVNKLQDLLQRYESIMPENGSTKREKQLGDTPKRLRVHGTDGGDPLGFGKPMKESFSTRANRAKKFVNQVIQMHAKNAKEKHSSIDDFVVRSREELLAEIEAKKAAEAAKNAPKVEQAKPVATEAPSTEEPAADYIDDEYKEDFEEMDRLLGNNE